MSSPQRFARRTPQRQDTLLGAFCSIPALSVTVSFSTLSSLLVNTRFTWETLQTDSFVSLTNFSQEPAHRPHPCNQISRLVERVESIAHHSLRENHQGHHAVANGIDAKTRSLVPSVQRSLHHVTSFLLKATQLAFRRRLAAESQSPSRASPLPTHYRNNHESLLTSCSGRGDFTC